MGQQSPRVLSTDPNAGEPLRTSGGAPRVLSTDPNAGEPLRVQASKQRGWFDTDFVTPPRPEDFPVVNLLKGAWNVAKEIPAGIVALAKDLPPRLDPDGSVHFPLEQSIKGIAGAHVNTGAQAVESFRGGDYITAGRKAMNAAVPVLGPVLDASEDTIQQGQIAEGIGEVGTNVLLTALGMRPKAAAVPGARPAGRVPRNPAEAAAVQFAREEGIPLDAATATGSQYLRSLQKRAGGSWGGANTVEAAQAAQGDALAAAADRLAQRANAGGPAVGPVEAGEGVRAALQGRVKDLHGQANRAYGRVRDAEAAAPEEMVQARPQKPEAAPHVTPEQSFLLRWLSKDLEENQFTPSSRMPAGARRLEEWQKAKTAEEFNEAVYSPRAAGTQTQSMFEALGIKGSRPEIAMRIERHLTGQKKDARLTKLADAFNEAFDGERFDFDLVSDDTLSALGIRRRDLRSPETLPDYAEAGAATFYPEWANPAAPRGGAAAGETAMRLAVDLRSAKDAMRPVLQQLEMEREVVGVLHGDKAKAAVALRGLVDGPDFASLSTVDAALSPIKKLASADMPQLRSRGQGLLSKLVSELDAAVKGRAQAAGGDVAQALSEGRAATRAKYQTADVMKRVAPKNREPRAVFDALTRNRDAGIQKLRDLQKQAPAEVPNVARALLEDLFDLPTATGGFKGADGAFARWHKIGGDTKAILFPDRGHRVALDRFFLLAKKIGENPNPSGTAQVLNATNLLAGIPMFGLAKLLYSQRGVNALTGVLEVSGTRPGAKIARAAALAQLSRAAKEAGVTLEGLPAAAEAEPGRQE